MDHSEPVSIRAERAGATREAILVAAERLFAERGLFAVSNRQISEAAGQGNNAAVNYHFGTKTDLVRAIVAKHDEPIHRARGELVAAAGTSRDAREWIACWVRPVTDHLATLGPPTWLARFGAQVMTDPVFRELMISQNFSDPLLGRILEGLNPCCPPMPADVRLQRNYMTRQLVVHMLADVERFFAENDDTPAQGWQRTANGLIDALVGLWLAPVTPSE